jgi:hypothetical protein
MGLTTINTYEIVSVGGGWIICGNGHANNMKRYGTITKNGDDTFYAQRMIPAGFRSDKAATHIGVFTDMATAARAVVADYCDKYGGRTPEYHNPNTKESDEVTEMPSMQVIYDAHVVVDINPDGSASARAMLASGSPEVNDAEGRTVEANTLLHKAACDAAAELVSEDSYSMPINVVAK